MKRVFSRQFRLIFFGNGFLSELFSFDNPPELFANGDLEIDEFLGCGGQIRQKLVPPMN